MSASTSVVRCVPGVRNPRSTACSLRQTPLVSWPSGSSPSRISKQASRPHISAPASLVRGGGLAHLRPTGPSESVSYVEENLMKPLSVKQEEIIKEETLDFQENQKEPENSELSHGTVQKNDPDSDMLVHSDIINPVSCGSELPQTHTAHIGRKTFQCPESNKCLNTNASLGIHRRVLIGEKMFACSECGKCFRIKCEVTAHERLHTGEKPFACSGCEKCFKTKGELTAHERLHTRIHTGEKPFACSECEKCFTTKGELTAHERIHTGENNYILVNGFSPILSV
uniref:C2H2-type domain-containing protein n=1 Tax=Leptobrachium leishanense TaxID=445787 RepID=A0A8C5PJ69_9ANUR